MSGSTNFKQFDPSKQLMADDTTYESSIYRTGGVMPGIAPPDIHNKLYYQTSTMCTALANSMVAAGYVANDTDIDDLTSKITSFITGVSGVETVESTGYGVITGLSVIAQSTPNMTVSVAAGTIHMPNGNRFTPAAVSSQPINTADATNPRIDLIYISSDGIVSYLAGTAAVTPISPILPTGAFGLANITVAANATAITNSNIIDIRIIKKSTQEEISAINSLITFIKGTIKGQGEYTNSYDSQSEKHVFSLRTIDEWDLLTNAKVSGGTFSPTTTNTLAFLCRALENSCDTISVQARIYWDNTQNSPFIGFNYGTSGTAGEISQRRMIGLTANAGFNYYNGTSNANLYSYTNLSTGWYILTLTIAQRYLATMSIKPEVGTLGSFSYTIANNDEYPSSFTNIMLQTYGATDMITDVKYICSNSASSTMLIPNIFTCKNYHLPITVNVSNVKTYAMIPSSYNANIKSRCVIYCHGAGGHGNDEWIWPNENLVLQPLLDAGYIVISSEYTDLYSWGNYQATVDMQNLINYYKLLLNIGDLYVVMESMGGLVALNSISHSILLPRAIAGIFPACNLSNMYNGGAGLLASSIQTAYNFTSASDFGTATHGYDALNDNDGTVFKNIPMVFWASPDDTTVNKAQNSDALATKVNSIGGNIIVNTCSGNHGDVSAYQGPAIVSFFNQY